MTCHTAISVDDDLAAGQPGVTHRAADNELAGRVNEHPHVLMIEVVTLQHRVNHEAT